MPRIVSSSELTLIARALSKDPCSLDQPASPEQCVAALREIGFDPRDEGSLLHGAYWLNRLGNNRSFLPALLREQLERDYGSDASAPKSAYSPQAIMLSGQEPGFFLRANIWPAPDDHCYQASGAHSFVYGAAHDHNFDFLTIGYFGPGYESDYYEYDFEKVAGFVGEKVDLRFIERAALEPGKIMHYRGLRDVHRQLPPASLSVSLNIMSTDPAQGWLNQYGFDLEQKRISAVLNPGASECALRIVVAMGDDDALALAEHFGNHHPAPRMRLAAFEARAAVANSAEARDAIWREAERSGSLMVAKEAAARRRELASAKQTGHGEHELEHEALTS